MLFRNDDKLINNEKVFVIKIKIVNVFCEFNC